MSGLSLRKIIMFLLSFALFCLSFAGLLFYFRWSRDYGKIEVSLDGGIYSGQQEITVKAYSKGTVYFSINREEPQVYLQPVRLSPGKDGTCYDLSFYEILKDGTQTKVLERSYYITAPEHPMTTDYVISLWGDEEALFGYEEGILVGGKLFDENWEKDPDVLPWFTPANYFSNKEVPVYSLILDRDGEVAAHQNCGVRVYGAATRAKNQKSLRLSARARYDEEKSFHYPFFSDLKARTGVIMDKYNKISLHNSGNDNGCGFIRNQLGNELARQAGFPDVLLSKTATVYVNEKYMGAYWLQNAYDAKYFEEKYGVLEEDLVVLEGKLTEVAPAEGKDELKGYAEELNDFLAWAECADPKENSTWERIENTIDVDNFLQYTAIEYYTNNLDWPYNNVKVWRSISEKKEQAETNISDGKYRFLLFDLDYGMGLYGYFDAETERLSALCDMESESPLFGLMMQNEDWRNSFINYEMNLLNGSFSADNVERVLNGLNDSRLDELSYMLEKTDFTKQESLWYWDKNTLEEVERNRMQILEFARKRPDYVRAEMAQLWGLGELAEMETDDAYAKGIRINGEPFSFSQHGVYYLSVPVTISYEADKGTKVNGYYLNKDYMKGERITVCLDDYVKNGKVTIEPDIKEWDCESLSIAGFHVSGNQDYVVLRNTGNADIDLEDYYLSDSEENVNKGRLPKIILCPGEEITFYGKKFDREAIDEKLRLNVSWNKEEDIILYHISEGIADKRKVCSKP